MSFPSDRPHLRSFDMQAKDASEPIAPSIPSLCSSILKSTEALATRANKILITMRGPQAEEPSEVAKPAFNSVMDQLVEISGRLARIENTLNQVQEVL